MQIVIDVSKEKYEIIKRLNGTCSTDYKTSLMLYNAVANGTPLPKGHGRLIDEKEMLKRLDDWNWEDVIEKSLCNFVLNRIIESPTIIEADKHISGKEKE